MHNLQEQSTKCNPIRPCFTWFSRVQLQNKLKTVACRFNIHIYIIYHPVRLFNPKIFVDAAYWHEERISDRLINLLFHELVHAYCYRNGINDCEEGHYHNLAFKKETETHGGRCGYADDYRGWSNANLSPDALMDVKQTYRIIK